MFTNQDPDLWENVKRTNENPQIFDVQMWGSGNSEIGHNKKRDNQQTTQCYAIMWIFNSKDWDSANNRDSWRFKQ